MLAAAREAMIEGLARWANPSSPHAEGRAARAALEDARARIKTALGWDHHLIFTGGATEAAAIALNRQAKARPVLVSAVEHLAVLKARGDAGIVPVGADGLVMLPDLAGAPLVAVQHANSETGIVQPLDAVAAAVRDAGGVLFADCAQSAVKLALPDADLIAVSAHKFGGPPGIGALLVRDLALLAPLGGSQEQGYRAGTENLPAILGFAAAAEAVWPAGQHELRDTLDSAIRDMGGSVVGEGTPRIATISSYRMPGVKSAAQLIQFDMAGIAISAGSACSSGSIHTSHVLKAMGIDEVAASEVIRVSFGRDTSLDDIRRFADAWGRIAGSARTRAA